MKKTRKRGMISNRLLTSVILISFASLFLVASSCSVLSYLDPDVYPVEGEDVLIPGEAVKIIGFTEDGNPIVSPEFMDWMERLKQEISRLRVLLLGEEKLDKIEEVIKD